MVIIEVGYWQIWQYEGDSGNSYVLSVEDRDLEYNERLWPLLVSLRTRFVRSSTSQMVADFDMRIEQLLVRK